MVSKEGVGNNNIHLKYSIGIRVEKLGWRKIIVGIFMLLCMFLILSLLSGSGWIMNIVLYFSNDVLCEDMNQDGVDDFCQYWDNGQLTRLEWDTNYDGKVDVWQIFRPNGDLFQLDSNYDGNVDYRETVEGGGKHLIEIDSDFNGTFDKVTSGTNN